MRALVGLDGGDDIGRQRLVLPALVSGSGTGSTSRALADVDGRRQVGKRCRERKTRSEAVDDAGRILPVFGIEAENRTGCKLGRRLISAFQRLPIRRRVPAVPNRKAVVHQDFASGRQNRRKHEAQQAYVPQFSFHTPSRQAFNLR